MKAHHMSCSLEKIPEVILVVGTDASGKDHVANILQKLIADAGGAVEKRKRYLTGKITHRQSSAGKPWYELLLERGFLWVFPYLGWLLPWCLNWLLRRDLKRLRQPEKKVIVVGHNCLRGLAFYWGHKYSSTDQVPIHRSLEKTLSEMRSISGIHTLVLDIDDDIRKKRIHAREARGEADFFDRYLAASKERSENIENILVWLSRKYLDGRLIRNNDLSEKQLCKEIITGFSEKQKNDAAR